MSRLRALGAFLYDFVIGEDPLIAVGVVVALGLTAALAGAGVAAWWMLPLAVVAVLTLSLYRATRSERDPDDQVDNPPVT
jgi:hydrogenase/urease accessory protein HupE